MLHQKTVKYNRYQEQKELRIQQALDTLSIDMDERGTFARVPSTSGTGTYIVMIDESERVPVATNCQCVGHTDFGHYCIHMIATDRLFARVYARPEKVVIDEPALEGVYAERLEEWTRHTAPDAYEVLASTKDVINNKINPRTGMTDAEWQAYRYYLMGIGV